ncbi:MAG: YfcE family phosphodiesterase [Flammeovirgaceae bacterium]|nr:YfcE family phosphodiesterase [Flammeovirgaceae bacterium]|tara:strand:- start:81 stop:584 length:504 start_codon:yes stop_codon:yes gene_type:complete
MKVGLISDTHSYLDPKIFHYFKECDEIWHAGDAGKIELLDELENFKPLRAVFGNIDGHDIRMHTTEIAYISCSGMNIMMTHIAGKPPSYTKKIKTLLLEKQPNILVCGHSHILKVMFDKKYNIWYLNPGAAGNHGFHKVKTLLRFEIGHGKIFNMEAVEIGLRALQK